MKYLQKISEKVQQFEAEVFEKLTEKIAVYPKRTVKICLMIVLLCSLGWLRFSQEDDPQKFLTPQDSRAVRDRAFIEDRFEDPPSQSHVMLNRRNDGDNILKKEALLEVFDLHERIELIDSRKASEGYDSRTCAQVYWRTPDELPCRRESILAFWDYNRTSLQLDTDILETINTKNNMHIDCCSSSQILNIDSIASKIHYDSHGRIISVGALLSTYYLKQDLHSKTRQDPVVYRLEKDFDRTLRRQRNLKYFEKAKPLTAGGINENVDAAFAFDERIVMLAFISISTYAYFALASRQRQRHRGMLGLQALGCVALAIASGWGLCFFFGVELSPLGTVAAFLVLGIGLDDAFVIIGGIDEDSFPYEVNEILLDNTQNLDDAIDRVAARLVVNALKLAGPSILTTTTTDACAFFAGSYTRIPAISNFCTFAAVSVLADFFLQVTLFVALFVFDTRKKLRMALDERNKNQNISNLNIISQQVQESSIYKPTTWYGLVYAKYLLSIPGIFFVLTTTIVITTLGIIGSMHVTMDFRYNWFYVYGVGSNYVPKNDHFLRKRFKSLSSGEESAAYYGLYTKDADYFLQADAMQNLIYQFSALKFVDPASLQANWYSAHQQWLIDTSQTIPSDSQTYLISIKQFLASDDGRAYNKKIFFDPNSGQISATEINTRWLQPKDARQSIHWMRAARRRAKDAAPQLRPIVFAPPFVWIEGLAIITNETIRSLAIATSVVIFVLITLLGDLALAALVGSMVVSICLCVYGSIYWYGDHLNFISGFFIIISVGLATDAPAHIAHTYIHAPTNTARDRVVFALDTLGSSVFRGAFSTLLGTLVIGFAKTYVFQTFFWYLTSIMVLSMWFGLAVAPCSLALIGPYLYSTKISQEVSSKSKAVLTTADSSEDDTDTVVYDTAYTRTDEENDIEE
mmetsp:Transcript_17963/g.27014  ORF Transcript_17963/g.27014 Transcript_17963/m.27014 type:complete len:917 (+) Transcript_17963:103-2853(+)|eukprot:CAMPEP_0197317234 /NCGR_PEP_ID=MMETSP0891-20130614/45994_1 /TAXON_ID=44058 ORGANISM="Aureoumbra lagunensis, Strain CCMP1510" /NCGR_SAMPLE_ID=MMETSP0891 /ASSEMBLY_ACC=CAM_ASM_000534 /LENGTH=916 /DNA_ID=CAMNT_0042807105 /DNA_START=74 /DNA_END=2824 /DNA_ORIENTATION=-